MDEKIPLDKAAVKRINPVTLAFVGDAVYSLYVRARLVQVSDGKPSQLQRATAKVVSAKGQSQILEALLPCLTEEEGDVFRRGRNAKKPTKSKSASAGEYNRSTGLEAVLGYLYLTGQNERLTELMDRADEQLFQTQKAATPYKPTH